MLWLLLLLLLLVMLLLSEGLRIVGLLLRWRRRRTRILVLMLIAWQGVSSVRGSGLMPLRGRRIWAQEQFVLAVVGLGVVGAIVAAVEALPSTYATRIGLLGLPVAGDGVLDRGHVAVTPLAVVAERHDGNELVVTKAKSGVSARVSVGIGVDVDMVALTGAAAAVADRAGRMSGNSIRQNLWWLAAGQSCVGRGL
jgi:hypothetical protein